MTDLADKNVMECPNCGAKWERKCEIMYNNTKGSKTIMDYECGSTWTMVWCKEISKYKNITSYKCEGK